MSDDPPTPPLVLAERRRITTPIDDLIADFESRPLNYDVPTETVIDILEYLKERINVSDPRLSDNE